MTQEGPGSAFLSERARDGCSTFYKTVSVVAKQRLERTVHVVFDHSSRVAAKNMLVFRLPFPERAPWLAREFQGARLFQWSQRAGSFLTLSFHGRGQWCEPCSNPGTFSRRETAQAVLCVPRGPSLPQVSGEGPGARSQEGAT